MSEGMGNATASDFTEAMKSAIADALGQIGRVNIAIFGRTGVGKSTLINAFFGDGTARTGIGRPITQGMDYYEHQSGILGIFDSQGFETGQSGDALLKQMRTLVEERRKRPVAQQIHVIWYCVKSTDQRFEDSQAMFVRALADLRLPVLMVMTQVEYDRHDEIHPDHLDLGNYIESLSLPLSPKNQVIYTNARADEHARNATPVHGLDELLERTYEVVPKAASEALTAAQHVDIQRKVDASRRVALQMAAVAAAAAAIPIPLADAAALVPIQVSMMARIGALWDMPVKAQTLSALATSAFFAQGVVSVAQVAVRSLLGLVPFLDIAAKVVQAGVASALTYAVGEAWIAVCIFLSDKDEASIARLVDSPELKRIFLDAFKERVKKPVPQ